MNAYSKLKANLKFCFARRMPESLIIKQLQASVFFSISPKDIREPLFSDVFMGLRKRTLTWNRLNNVLLSWKQILGSNPPEVFLGKGVLKISNKFTGEHPYWSMLSTKLLCNFIEIALRHWCSPVNLLHVFRIPFPKSTPGGLLLNI